MNYFSWRALRPGSMAWRHGGSILLAALAIPAWGAEDAALRALQQTQLLRQQQQDQLQLRMQQYQRNGRNPPADARQRQTIERLELDQQLRQQQLHHQQQRELQVRPELPSDDEGTRRAKARIDEQRARQESRRQLDQFDRELQIRGAEARQKEDGYRLPGVPNPRPGELMLNR